MKLGQKDMTLVRWLSCDFDDLLTKGFRFHGDSLSQTSESNEGNGKDSLFG